jgi:hypothetical protein
MIIIFFFFEGLFWSDWGAKPQIVRAGMDGTEVTLFVTTRVVWPDSLALNYPLATSTGSTPSSTASRLSTSTAPTDA